MGCKVPKDHRNERQFLHQHNDDYDDDGDDGDDDNDDDGDDDYAGTKSKQELILPSVLPPGPQPGVCSLVTANGLPCDPGLAFSPLTGSCEWPDTLIETGCNPEGQEVVTVYPGMGRIRSTIRLELESESL